MEQSKNTGDNKTEYSYTAGNESAPKNVEQGPSNSHLAGHKLQHVDYSSLTGSPSTEL